MPEENKPLSLMEMADADNAKAASPPPDPADDSAVADAPPVEKETEDPAPEGESDPPETNPDDARAIVQYARELLGDDAASWLDTFKDDESFLRSALETKRMVGSRSADAEFVNRLEAMGITAQDLSNVMALKSGKQPTPAAPTAKVWDNDWVTVNEKGEWVPTAKGRAQPDIEQKIRQRQIAVSEALREIPDVLEALKNNKQPSAEETKAEIERRLAADKNERDFQDWQRDNAKLLFADAAGNMTPLGAAVQRHLDSGEINPNLPYRRQAEKALRDAMNEARPAAKAKPDVPEKARRQPAQNSTPAKMTDEEYFKKYGNKLSDFMVWKETGKAPDQK